VTDDAVTAHIPYGSILLFHKSFLTEYGSCDNTQAADAEQDDPEMHHAIVADLRDVRIGRKTYVVLTYVALAVGVFILVSRCVGLVSASTFVPMVILIGFPIGAVCVGVSKSRSDLEAADRALDRILFGSTTFFPVKFVKWAQLALPIYNFTDFRK
jgi:MFS superfamily sulfate permease-like transporter